ncbi:unnamed protein product [Cuscuta epithymum]|uniref:Uncharacterized protein n=1 Tax=Cuscuta epithymum TaxID=186058 RepID=A0AAV0DFX0_9ASTE|nr:unnamed protein product [Cuscuta epithymum]CAH9128569.1 unnamed protein product [Cuscuta epithymum]
MNLQVCSSDRCKQGNRGGDSAEAGLLTARDENRGEEAVSLLHKQGLSNVVFHQLDVLDKHGVPRLENYLKAQYGRLDILVDWLFTFLSYFPLYCLATVGKQCRS